MFLRCVWIACLLIIFGANLVYAAIPRKIHYQGRITTTSNSPISPGVYKITLRIYDAEEGGNLLWEETHNVDIDQTGYFNISLGENTPLNLDFTQPYWMSVEINDDGEMSPRLPLLSVGYSINSDRLDGVDSFQFLRSDTDDVMEGNLTIQGNTTMQSTLIFEGASVDITAKSGENLRLKATDNAGVLIDVSATSSNFKVVNGSLEIISVDNTGNVVISGKDSTKFVKIYPGNLLVGDSAPSGFFSGGDVYISGDLYVNGAVNFASSSTGDNALTIDVDSDEALIVRKNNDNGDVFVVDTNNSEVEVSDGTGVDETSRKSIKLKHDGTDGIISTNSGALKFSPADNVVLSPSTGVSQVIGQLQVANSNATDAVVIQQTGAGGKALVVNGGLTQVGSGTIDHVSTSGDLYVANNLEVDGSTWLGDATTDNLTVTGSLTFSGDLDMQGSRIYNIGSSNSEFTATGGLTLNDALQVNATSTFNQDIVLPNAINVDLVDATASALTFESGLLTFDTQNLRLGINTTSPAAMMELYGQDNELRLSYDSTNYVSLSSTSTGTLAILSSNTASSAVEVGSGAENSLLLLKGDDVTYYYIAHDLGSDTLRIGIGSDPTTSVFLTLTSGGNVGIGTTSPSARLYVSGTTNLAGATTVSAGNLTVNAGNVLVSAGNVGIGQATPLVGLHIGIGAPTQASVSAQEDAFITGDLEVGGVLYLDGNLDAGGNSLTNLADPVNLQDAATKNYVDTQVSSTVGSSVSGTANYIAKFTATNAVGDSHIYEDAVNYYIGINTTSPSAQLEVNGETKLDGNLSVGDTTTPTTATFYGGTNSGDYAVKIYAGTDLVAWVRKK